MPGPFDFLHIKGHTEGSSNELSFDVLDAARSDADSQKKRGSRISPGIKPSQGSYHGVAGSSTLSAAPEVERRKRARRAHTRRIWVIAIVAILAFVGTGSYLGYLYYQSKVDFGGRFNVLIDRLVEVDKTIVNVDELMQNPQVMVDENASSNSSTEATKNSDEQGLSSAAQEASRKIPSLRRELNAINAEAQKLREAAARDDERVVLSQLQAATEAREKMFGNAEEALALAKQAGMRVVKINDAWTKVLEADEMARSAAEAANEANTEEATLDARRMTESARVLFIGAKEELEVIEVEKPKLNLSLEKSYIDKRAESLEAAVRTANALLASNREGAVAANNAYNEADKEAASLALSLPASEGSQVTQAYQTQFQNMAKEYDKSRAAATTADSSLRSYLDNR